MLLLALVGGNWRNNRVVPKISLEISDKTGVDVCQELVASNLEGEVDLRQILLSRCEGLDLVQTDHDRETTPYLTGHWIGGMVASLTAIRAEILQCSIPGQHADQDFLTGDTHDQRAEPLGQSRHGLVAKGLTVSSDITIDTNTGICGLCRHLSNLLKSFVCILFLFLCPHISFA